MKIILLTIFISLPYFMQAQTVKEFPVLKGDYLGQKPPGNIPEVFAPGIVSSSNWAEHCPLAVSPKGDEIFWSAWRDGSETIYYSKIIDGKWTAPKRAEFTSDKVKVEGGPVFSHDGKRLYFYSVNRSGGIGEMDVWYVEKVNGVWGNPINVDPPYNTDKDDWTPMFTGLNNAYRNWIGGLIRFKYEKGKFSSPETVIINKDFKPAWTIYFSPDETYSIFAAEGKDTYGGLDLYISFKQQDGSWKYPKNMGNKINSKYSERFPIISTDGKYLFFMRETKPDQDIMWISASIINELRKQSLDN